jgi:uncharacterized phiE125 gp8 family phage protein
MRMACWEMTRLEAPAALLSLDEARLHLRVTAEGEPPAHPEDTLIESFVQAATNELDGADGWLGRALATQSWRLTLDAFPAGAIRLPLPPLQAVTRVAFVAPDGATEALAPSAYRVIRSDTDPARVEPAYGTAWPTVRRQSAAVEIDYTCGFGQPTDVPELIRQYIRLRVGQFYENREMVAIGVTVAEIPFMASSLESFRRRVRPV